MIQTGYAGDKEQPVHASDVHNNEISAPTKISVMLSEGCLTCW